MAMVINHNIETIIVAPMTTQSHKYPTRLAVSLKGKSGYIVLDQIRTLDKSRFKNKAGDLSLPKIRQVKTVLKKMLVD